MRYLLLGHYNQLALSIKCGLKRRKLLKAEMKQGNYEEVMNIYELNNISFSFINKTESVWIGFLVRGRSLLIAIFQRLEVTKTYYICGERIISTKYFHDEIKFKLETQGLKKLAQRRKTSGLDCSFNLCLFLF